MKFLYRANVTRITTNGVYVEVPHIATGMEFGPCQVNINSTLMVGDRVIVGQVEQIDEDLVIIAHIGDEATPPVSPEHEHAQYLRLTGADMQVVWGETNFRDDDPANSNHPNVVVERDHATSNPSILFHNPGRYWQRLVSKDSGLWVTGGNGTGVADFRAGGVYDNGNRVFSPQNNVPWENLNKPYGMDTVRKDQVLDLNEVRVNGFYAAAGGSFNTPEGPGASGGWWLGYVLTHDPSPTNRWCIQVFSRMTGAPAMETFKRLGHPDGWGAWTQVRDNDALLDERYYTEAEVDNLLSQQTHDHLFVATDDRAVATQPNDYNDKYLVRFRSLAALALAGPSGSYAQVVGFRAWDDSSGGQAHEYAHTDSGVWHRQGATTTWGVWKKIIDYTNATVFTNDSRLTDARNPLAHTHDDRYFTETESDARFVSQRTLPVNGGTTSWIRLATINGGNSSGGASIVLMCAGQGNYGAATRTYDIVSFGQRGDNVYSFSGTRMGPSPTPWVYSVKQISTYVFELWAKRWAYDSAVGVTVLHSWNGTLNVDSQTTTLPTGLTPQELSSSPDLGRAVNVYNGSWPARPAAKYVEWMGPVAPGAGLMQANDVFTDTSS